MPDSRLAVPCVLLAAAVALAPAMPLKKSRGASIVINKRGDAIRLYTPGLVRTIRLGKDGVASPSLKAGSYELLAGPAREFRIRFLFASPNRPPKGLKAGEGGAIDSVAQFRRGTDSLELADGGTAIDEGVRWANPVLVHGDASAKDLGAFRPTLTRPADGVTRLTLRAGPPAKGALAGVSVTLVYEVYAGFPAVRKWLDVSNGSAKWMKIDHLLIDDLQVVTPFKVRVPLTPAERGAGSSLVALTNQAATVGVIAASEVPSALRQIAASGGMGYTDQLFEWVLGPGESFTSEPVFLFGFAGKAEKLPSGLSTPLDRIVEGPLQRFLRQRIGIVAAGNLPGPTWVTWSNFRDNVNDAVIRQQAGLAARAGFDLLAIDDGWQKDRLGTDVDTKKFPDFAATAEYVRAKGLRLGLWVSCFRSPDSKDLKTPPGAASRPAIRRLSGFGMSFASPWRRYYAQDLAGLSRRYGVTYFKQDFSNIRFGDAAAEHESRTQKESLLRGLRGLLEAQDLIRREAPGVTTEITHEIYWGTPGVPCDLAALKHAALYHIPPNDYSGEADNGRRWDPARKYDSAKLRRDLLDGCFHARERFYAHRGLPLERLEYYASATFSGSGSLTPAIQDRQIASWLMGAPRVFAGDLSSLTPENVAHYRKRFELLKRLEAAYGIYEHFQYSGVPAPTDKDWHWWGKLNGNGEGVVVVIRGSAGDGSKEIAIPWAALKQRYKVKALFAGKDLGTFTGRELVKGKLDLSLPPYGQEILELSAAR